MSQGNGHVGTAPFDRMAGPGMVHQDQTHQASGDAEEVRSILALNRLRLIQQAQVRFVDQGSRRQRVVGPCTPQEGACQSVQFGIDQRRQVI